jgi:hypothetical protein
MIGTRWTIRPRSGRIEKTPRPAAACLMAGTSRSSPGNVTRNCRTAWASARGTTVAEPTWPTTTRDRRIASANSSSLLGRSQVVAEVVVEIAEARRGDAGRHSVRLRENGVEADRHDAELGEPGNGVCDDRAWPQPLADLFNARFIDVDNDDRTATPSRVAAASGRDRRSATGSPRAAAGRQVHDPQRDERKQEQDVDRPCQTALRAQRARVAMPSLLDFALEGGPILQAIITCQAAHQRTAPPIVEDAADIFPRNACHCSKVALGDLLPNEDALLAEITAECLAKAQKSARHARFYRKKVRGDEGIVRVAQPLR